MGKRGKTLPGVALEKPSGSSVLTLTCGLACAGSRYGPTPGMTETVGRSLIETETKTHRDKQSYTE